RRLSASARSGAWGLVGPGLSQQIGSYQVRDAELGFGDAAFGVVAVLGGDVDPLVEDDARHGSGHDVDAALIAEPFGLGSDHLADMRAIHMSEGLDAAIDAEHPP